MSKDPALLVYTKDFLEGTADLSVEEFGAYVRLIYHQHQRYVLPKNKKKLARLCGITLVEFEKIWLEIDCKFSLSEQGYFNQRCRDEMENRSKNTRLKSILATLGNWLKYNDSLTTKQKERIKSEFSAVSFLDIENKELRNEKIKKHLAKLAKAIAKRSLAKNGNVNVNNIEVKEEKEIYSENDFLNDWKKVRKRMMGATTNIDALTFHERQNFTRLKMQKDDIRKAIQGLFMQNGVIPATKLRPTHFLQEGNPEKYLSAFENKEQLYTKNNAL